MAPAPHAFHGALFNNAIRTADVDDPGDHRLDPPPAPWRAWGIDRNGLEISAEGKTPNSNLKWPTIGSRGDGHSRMTGRHIAMMPFRRSFVRWPEGNFRLGPRR